MTPIIIIGEIKSAEDSKFKNNIEYISDQNTRGDSGQVHRKGRTDQVICGERGYRDSGNGDLEQNSIPSEDLDGGEDV